MCRTNDLHDFRFRNRNSLNIKSFHVRFSGLESRQSLPESLTLLYLPRINETELVVDGSNIRPDSPAFLTLHRAVNVMAEDGKAVYWSREPVRATEGVRFEVYLTEEKVLEGYFRKDEKEEWTLECKCGLESEVCGGCTAADVAVAEVCVAVEGHVELREKVEMVSKRKKNWRGRGLDRLEVILEDREEVCDESDGECCRECKDCRLDGANLEETRGSDLEEACGPDCQEMDLKRVRWAVDVGYWVMCLGVGYLVSKASARSLRRLRIL